MHSYVYFDGRVLPEERALINVASDAVFYGHSVFTTIAVRGRRPVLLERHIERLKSSVETYRLAADVESVPGGINALIESNGIINGRLRITILNERQSLLPASNRSSFSAKLLISSTDVVEHREAFSVAIDPRIVVGPEEFKLKSGNYFDAVSRFATAKEAGFDEYLLENSEGNLVSGCLSNVFWQKDGKVRTPSLETGCLEGTVRGAIIENCKVEEVAVPTEEILEADSVFLTSSGIGVKPVSKIGEREFGLPELSPQLQEVADLFILK